MAGDLIQTPQTRWIHGAYESVQRGTPLTLVAAVTSNLGNDRWTTFRKQFETAGYAVTAGKTLYLTHLTLSATIGASYFRLIYGDTDVGSNSASAPTNYKSFMAGLGQDHLPWQPAAAESTYTFNVLITIPAGKYLAISPSNGAVEARFVFIGHEE